MSRSSYDPLWQKALAAATRNADPIVLNNKPNPVSPGQPVDKDRGEVAKPQPRYELQNAPKVKPNPFDMDTDSSKPVKPAPKDEGSKPDVSDECDTCGDSIAFCGCKNVSRPAAIDVPIMMGSESGPVDFDYPNEMDEK